MRVAASWSLSFCQSPGSETAEPVDLLDQENVAGLGVVGQAKQLGPRELCAALVLDVFGGDGEPALGGEGLELLGQRVDRRPRPGNRPPAFVAPERA
jgi:hypothetical protein